MSLSSAGHRRPCLVGAVLLCAALARATDASRHWHALPVEGGTTALARAAGLEPGLPAWRVLYEACRRRHGLWGEDAGGSPAHPAPEPVDAAVPLPLGPSYWRRLLTKGGEIPLDRLALAILADRRAALFYRGLAALDEETLAALASDPDALVGIERRHADVFAAFAARFVVRGGVVAVPGGPEAEPIWQALVGGRPRNPAGFLVRLVQRRSGRIAFLYDSLARLDPGRQRAALGLGAPGGSDLLAPARELAAAFDAEDAWWRNVGGAFARPDVDAARVLRDVRLADDGSVAPPAARAFWHAVFEGRTATAEDVRSSPRADLAWLAARVGSGAPQRRRLKLEQLAFAQRVFGAAAEGAPLEATQALAGLADARALVLALERMGVRDPGRFAAAVAGARAHLAVEPTEALEFSHAALQGALGVVDRARFSGGIDGPTAERLIRSLLQAPLPAAPRRGHRIADWVEQALLPALAGTRDGEESDADRTVLLAMAGAAAEHSAPPAFRWEGLWYRAQPELAQLRRLEDVRRRQGGRRLGDSLLECRTVPDASGGACAGAVGEALTSLVYAAHLGEPDGPALGGEDPARRHSFLPEPWALPTEVSGPGVRWHVRGSLLGLEVALARLSLRPLEPDRLPEQLPAIDAVQRGHLAMSVGLASPLETRDAERDSLARAVADGRRRARALRAGGTDVAAAAHDAGLDPWRARGLEWLLEHEPSALSDFFSLAELAYLGAPSGGSWDAWGAPDPVLAGLHLRFARPRPLDESAGRRPEAAVAESFVDLAVRVALHLAERGLPASLSPALVSTVLPDLMVEARPVAPDDRLGLEAWVRGVPGDRLDDAVASLVGRGPLQPAPAPGSTK